MNLNGAACPARFEADVLKLIGLHDAPEAVRVSSAPIPREW